MKLLTVLMEDANFPRKLDINLPLLSTRRLGCHTGGEGTSCTANSGAVLQEARDGIPFFWERAPGKPKDDVERIDIHEGETPRPRLPPCRWRPEKENDSKVRAAAAATGNFSDHDEGCDADVDDDDNDLFSDAIDMLSLTEAIDIAQKAEDEHESENRQEDIESAEFNDRLSPNFMIERFLPDATALAASSVLYASRNPNKLSYSWSYSDMYGNSAGKPCSSEPSEHKGCGMDIFFPWRVKHKLCGMKSPVRTQISPNLEPHSSGKHKKHFSLADKRFGDVRK